MIEKINIEMIDLAVKKSLKSGTTKESMEFEKDNDKNEMDILTYIKEGNYQNVKYKHLDIISRDGKKRHLSICSFKDRVIMHVILLCINNQFRSQLSDDAFNCIQYRGINSKYKRGDANHMIKRYMNSDYWGYLQLDIHHCYESTQEHAMKREAWKYCDGDKLFLDLLMKYTMCEKGLPIGTPMSPIAHHILMIPVDNLIHSMGLKEVRYADDIVLFGDKEKLHTAYWRISNTLWYNYGYELKKIAHPTPIRVPLDILGYVYTKGHTKLRKSVKARIKKNWNRPLSKASYMGMLKGCDSINFINKMNINDLITDTTLVKRRMDSPLGKIEDLENKVFNILDFEVRSPSKRDGKYWMRMQIQYEEKGKSITRLIKGYHSSICLFFLNIEKKMHEKALMSDISFEDVRKKILPIEGVTLINDKGWYFKGTILKNE